MKPFKLDAVLDYRKRAEDAARRELVSILEEREVVSREKTREEEEIRRLREELGEAKNREVRVSELMLYDSCIFQKKHQVNVLVKKLADMDAGIRRKRQKLVRASQEKRALEIVRDNREKREKEMRKHAEDIFMDEVAVIRFGGGAK